MFLTSFRRRPNHRSRRSRRRSRRSRRSRPSRNNRRRNTLRHHSTETAQNHFAASLYSISLEVEFL